MNSDLRISRSPRDLWNVQMLIFPSAIRSWNYLHPSIKNANSTDEFKRKLSKPRKINAYYSMGSICIEWCPFVFDSGNIVNISGNTFLYPPQGHPLLILYKCCSLQNTIFDIHGHIIYRQVQITRSRMMNQRGISWEPNFDVVFVYCQIIAYAMVT